jgi:hypothetical protein
MTSWSAVFHQETPMTLRPVAVSALALLCACGGSNTSTSDADGSIPGNDGPVPNDRAAGEGAVIPATCPGTALFSDGVLDLDLKAVRLSGRITLDGAPLPDETADRGTLRFVAKATQVSFDVPLKVTGPVAYQKVVTPGVYDIELLANAALCTSGAPHLPCVGGPVRNGVAITADGVLDLDLHAIHVTGAVTLKGQPMPDEASARGTLRFALEHGGSVATASFGSRGAVTYALTLMPGTYTVGLEAGAYLCTQGTPAVPCVSGPLRTGLALAADGVLDIDIPAVRVNGAVTLKGQPMPDAAAERGALRFALDEGGSLAKAFGSKGSVNYALTLLPGSYTVGFDANVALCASGSPAIPCISGPLRKVALTGDGVLDIDIPAVKVSGAVTLRGQPMPTESGARGALTLTLDGGGATTTKAFGSSGPVTYAVTLLPGAYAVNLEANPSLCLNGTPAVPCVSGPLRTGLALKADGVLDVDIPAIKVSGVVTLNGKAMPAEAADRGTLHLALDHGGSVGTRPFGKAGAATYALTLLPGTYALRLDANGGLCASAQPAVPCVGGPLKSGVALNTDGVLDVNIPAVKVSGAVTLRGQPLAHEAGDRGHGVFALVGGDAVPTVSFGQDGPVTYHLTLLAGKYVVKYAGNLALCGATLPALPCMDQMLSGCP